MKELSIYLFILFCWGNGKKDEQKATSGKQQEPGKLDSSNTEDHLALFELRGVETYQHR